MERKNISPLIKKLFTGLNAKRENGIEPFFLEHAKKNFCLAQQPEKVCVVAQMSHCRPMFPAKFCLNLLKRTEDSTHTQTFYTVHTLTHRSFSASETKALSLFSMLKSEKAQL